MTVTQTTVGLDAMVPANPIAACPHISLLVVADTMPMYQVDEDGEEHSKVSKVNLVDLAGSERSDAAGTSGVRLRVRWPI